MGKDLKGKELGKGISQRKNGTYQGRYFDRFGNRKTIYEKSLTVLRKKLSGAIYEDEHHLNIVDSKITLNEWFEKWMIIYKNPCIRPNTKRHYTHIFKKHISPELGNIKLSEITKLQIKALINHLNEKGLQWETQNKVKILLIDMFDRAMEDDFVLKNPAKSVKLCKDKPSSDAKVLSVEDQALFFECSAGRFYDNLFIVAINSGLRPGELFALTENDIDFNKKEISVVKTLLYQELEGDSGKTFHIMPPKTTLSKRIVPMNKACEKALKKQVIQKNIISKRFRNDTEFSNLLFTTKLNTPLNSQIYSDAIKAIVNDINLMRDSLEAIEPFSGHVFRHTFATRCIEAGVQPKTVQKYLGHATLQMTMDLYVHVTDEFKKSEMNKFEEELNKICVSDELIDERYQKMREQGDKIIDFALA